MAWSRDIWMADRSSSLTIWSADNGELDWSNERASRPTESADISRINRVQKKRSVLITALLVFILTGKKENLSWLISPLLFVLLCDIYTNISSSSRRRRRKGEDNEKKKDENRPLIVRQKASVYVRDTSQSSQLVAVIRGAVFIIHISHMIIVVLERFHSNDDGSMAIVTHVDA